MRSLARKLRRRGWLRSPVAPRRFGLLPPGVAADDAALVKTTASAQLLPVAPRGRVIWPPGQRAMVVAMMHPEGSRLHFFGSFALLGGDHT
jgi:hypothetical protein